MRQRPQPARCRSAPDTPQTCLRSPRCGPAPGETVQGQRPGYRAILRPRSPRRARLRSARVRGRTGCGRPQGASSRLVSRQPHGTSQCPPPLTRPPTPASCLHAALGDRPPEMLTVPCRATGGRPGERIGALRLPAAAHRDGRPLRTLHRRGVGTTREFAQYTLIAFTDRLLAAGRRLWLGVVGHGFDHLAESVIEGARPSWSDQQGPGPALNNAKQPPSSPSSVQRSPASRDA
jgi:hypothetical protein